MPRRLTPEDRSGQLTLMAIVVTTAPLWIFLGAKLLHGGLFSDILEGPEITGAGHPNRIRNALELASFVATAGLFTTAMGALWFTVGQISEARRTRLATIYMEIISRWNAAELVESRTLILSLSKAYATDPRIQEQTASAADFIDLVLSTIRMNDLKTHRKHVAILNFYEDVGALCWKRYVREEDIFDFMAGQIVTQVELLASYIDSARNKGPDTNKTTYSNTIYLFNNAKAYRSKLHEEEWPPG